MEKAITSTVIAVVVTLFTSASIVLASDGSYPMANEYDEIIKAGDGYLFCVKESNGFANNTTEYGIYDTTQQEWVYPFTELPFTVNEDYFDYCGQGTFCQWTGSGLYLISPYADNYVFYDLEFMSHYFHFSNDVGFAYFSQESGYIADSSGNYHLRPSGELYMIDLYNSYEKVNLDMYGYSDPIYWKDDDLAAEYSKNDLFASRFSTLYSDDYYMYVYLYAEDKTVIIDAPDCNLRGDIGFTLSYEDGTIKYHHMRGDDGEYYCAEFNTDGELLNGPYLETEEGYASGSLYELAETSSDEYFYKGMEVDFGTWWFDNPMSWYVLETNEDSVMLIATESVEYIQFNEDRSGYWYESTLRSWLNGYGAQENNCGLSYDDYNFLYQAFTEEERSILKPLPLETENADGVVRTSDLVSILTTDEYYELIGKENFSSFDNADFDFDYWFRDARIEFGIAAYVEGEQAHYLTYSADNRSVFISTISVQDFRGVKPVVVVDRNSLLGYIENY